MAVAVLSPFDFNKTELLNAKLQNLGTDPTGLGAGDKGLLWIDASGAIKYWNGSATQTVGNATGGNATTLESQNGAYYLNRTNHTGTQLAATISDFSATARAAISVTDTATLDLTYAAGAISGAVLDSPTVGGVTPANLRDRSTHTGTQLAATVSDFNTAVRTNRLDQMAAPTAAVALNSQKITGMADGTVSTDAATFGQLLAVVQGQKWKDPVDAATTANIATLAGGAPNVLDGVTLVAGDRILVKDQTTTAQNGIYEVTTLGTGANGTWTRTADADTAAELTDATVLVQGGTAHAGDVFTQTAVIATIGTTATTIVKTGEGNTVYGADGTTITLTGSTFSVGTIGSGNLGVGAVDLSTTKVTGTLPGTKGGTGHSANAVGDLLVGAATNTWNRLAAVATGNVLKSAGVTTAPVWGKVDLTTEVSNALPIANGGTGQTSAAAALTALGGARKVAFDIGNGSLTAIVVNHALNTRDVQVSVHRNTTPWDTVMVDVERTDVNNVTIRFATAPAANAFRAVVVG